MEVRQMLREIDQACYQLSGLWRAERCCRYIKR